MLDNSKASGQKKLDTANLVDNIYIKVISGMNKNEAISYYRHHKYELNYKDRYTIDNCLMEAQSILKTIDRFCSCDDEYIKEVVGNTHKYRACLHIVDKTAVS
jgi:hypothetical protein